MKKDSYDIIVIGGGHAGCEAALASSRMGCRILLVTMHADKIGFMSCNPAIGGVGKGQLVKEIDALGGEMARAADACGIQFKVLNASKGPAVQSSRAQVGRRAYAGYIQQAVKKQDRIHILEAEAQELLVKDSSATGIKTDNRGTISAKAIVLAPGTFLNGLIHIGMNHFAGGRIEERRASSALPGSLRNLGFRLLRFKTGTCARLDGKTIDFSKLGVQSGDEPPRPFSFSTESLKRKQVPCYITYTDKKTHRIILKNLDRSPLFSGKIIGTGVRYCPSLEDKVVKFSHHQRHQIFLEPENEEMDEFYPNGLSTSMPEDVQEEFIRSVPGLEEVRINRFGYGIEHDTIDSTQLYPTLEAKHLKNLYVAGQINGTTGYEEAAAQGLIAGINAALKAKGEGYLILDRSTSYIGVLIDDLVTKGTNEPYRMFTSRVEYRLTLREDNADLRLRKIGYELGLVNASAYDRTQEKQRMIAEGIRYLRGHSIAVNGKKIKLFQFLKRPGVSIGDIGNELSSDYSENILRGIEIEVKYSGFIKRQNSDIKNFRNLEKIHMPAVLDYHKVDSISNEIREKLSRFRPLNLGQASRISGITPAAIHTLIMYLRKRKRQ